MQTYFIRHSSALDVDTATLKALWDGDYVGIHYPHDARNSSTGEDSQSLEPDDYSGSARHTLARLKKIGKEGGFIFSVYRGYPGAKVGFVEPGTDIKLFCGAWGSKNGQAGREAWLKVLKIKHTNTLSAFEGLSLTSVQPRQGTLCHWRKVGDRVKNLVSGNVKYELDCLTPDLQEVMCMEFLRTSEAAEFGLPQILYTLMPVGRTMKDLDILAIGYDSKPISAQVTFHGFSSTAAKEKLKKLDAYSREGGHTLLFCRGTSVLHLNRHIIFPLETVFKEFCMSSAKGEAWFKAVAGA
ncbi:hypothetical protein C1896_00375 [Pseudomonadaceae bacterium SI-3]|nr:hypothetical protein C1896_00375 [Pseudomonadaceae bacterium SI-3]